MITITVADSGRRFPATAYDETVATPRSVFSEKGVNISRAQVALSGTILSAEQLDCTFQQLGVFGAASLNAVTKGDGGSI